MIDIFVNLVNIFMLSALSGQSQCKSLCNLFSRIRLSGQKDRIDIRIVLCCIVGIGKCRRLIDFSLGRGISQLAQNHRRTSPSAVSISSFCKKFVMTLIFCIVTIDVFSELVISF